MKSDSETIDATELVSRFIEGLVPENSNRVGKGNQILRSWRAILESIKTKPRDGEPPEQMGRNLASHSRIIDIKNGVLLIEADHSAWLQLLQVHKKYILGCLQRRFPELEISALAFRVRGSSASLSDVSEDYAKSMQIARAEQAKRYEAEARYLSARGFSEPAPLPEGKELPQNLKKIFDKMRSEMQSRNGESF